MPRAAPCRAAVAQWGEQTTRRRWQRCGGLSRFHAPSGVQEHGGVVDDEVGRTAGGCESFAQNIAPLKPCTRDAEGLERPLHLHDEVRNPSECARPFQRLFSQHCHAMHAAAGRRTRGQCSVSYGAQGNR